MQVSLLCTCESSHHSVEKLVKIHSAWLNQPCSWKHRLGWAYSSKNYMLRGRGGAGFYKNRRLTRKLESLSFLTPIWLAIPNFEKTILEFWNTCSQRVQIVVKICAWGDSAPCAPTAAKWVAWIKRFFYQNYSIF